MPTVPPAPGYFNGYDENYRGFSPSRAAGLPDELSVAGSRIGPTPASGEPQPDLDTLAEMVDDAALQRADEVIGAELDAAVRWLRQVFPHEHHLNVGRSFGARLSGTTLERTVFYAAWVGQTLELGYSPAEATRKIVRRLRGYGGQGKAPGAAVAAD